MVRNSSPVSSTLLLGLPSDAGLSGSLARLRWYHTCMPSPYWNDLCVDVRRLSASSWAPAPLFPRAFGRVMSAHICSENGSFHSSMMGRRHFEQSHVCEHVRPPELDGVRMWCPLLLQDIQVGLTWLAGSAERGQRPDSRVAMRKWLRMCESLVEGSRRRCVFGHGLNQAVVTMVETRRSISAHSNYASGYLVNLTLFRKQTQSETSQLACPFPRIDHGRHHSPPLIKRTEETQDGAGCYEARAFPALDCSAGRRTMNSRARRETGV